jgi:hypothetical protein
MKIGEFMDSTGNNIDNIREKSLEWFFALNNVDKRNLKQKHFPNQFIQYSNHWGYFYTFGQIEHMYKNEHKKITL